MVDTFFRFVNFQLGLGRARGLGAKLLSHRVVGGYFFQETIFIR